MQVVALNAYANDGFECLWEMVALNAYGNNDFELLGK